MRQVLVFGVLDGSLHLVGVVVDANHFGTRKAGNLARWPTNAATAVLRYDHHWFIWFRKQSNSSLFSPGRTKAVWPF